MSNHTLHIEQINANTCRGGNEISGSIIDDLLSYTDKAKVFDKEKGYSVMVDVHKSFADNYGGVTTFPAGLINYIIEQANKKNISCDIEYIEPNIIKKKLFPKLPDITFEKYQSKMLKPIGIQKRGILVGPTGMGKSLILGGIIDKLNVPETIIIVPNKTILNQIYLSLCKWFNKNNVGKIGDSAKLQKHITVCLYQSLKKYTVKKSLKLILIDEAHLINRSIIKFLREKCKNIYYRYGVTATPQKPKHNFVKAMEMYGYIGPIINSVNDEEVIKRVLPVKVNLISFYCTNPKGGNYQEVLRQDVLYSKIRNAKFLKAAYNLAINKELTCLILVDETKQGQIIKDIAEKMNIDVTFVHGKLPFHFIKTTIRKFNERRIKTVIATKVFGVGTDIPNTDCVVIASARESEIDTLQKIGRGRRRTGKLDHLILIDSIDKVRGKGKYCKHFYKHSINRMNIYKDKEWKINRLTF